MHMVVMFSYNQKLTVGSKIPRKISGSANPDFFSGHHPEKKVGLYYKSEKKLRWPP